MSEMTQPRAVVVWDEETRARAGEIACRDCEACGGTCGGPREDMWCGAAAGMAERIRQAVRGRRVLYESEELVGVDPTVCVMGGGAAYMVSNGPFLGRGWKGIRKGQPVDVLIVAREEAL